MECIQCMFGSGRVTVSQVDLNLLVALDALLEHASVQDAAEQLHVTPPAMSRALTRLRIATGDEVLVRNGRTMAPTPRAVELRDEVRELVRRTTAVLTPVRRLELRQLRRTFTVRGNEALLVRLAPRLLAALPGEAPGVVVRLLAEHPDDGQELARGRADLEVTGEEPREATLRSLVAGRDRLVVVMREGHPLAASTELDTAAFASATHVSVSRRGRPTGALDEQLARHGLERRVVATLPSAAAALVVVRTSDLLAVVPEQLAAGETGLAVRDPPLPLPALTAVVSWHRRHDGDPVHTWFRTRVVAALGNGSPPA